MYASPEEGGSHAGSGPGAQRTAGAGGVITGVSPKGGSGAQASTREAPDSRQMLCALAGGQETSQGT